MRRAPIRYDLLMSGGLGNWGDRQRHQESGPPKRQQTGAMYQPGRTGARLSDQVATIASKMQDDGAHEA